MDALRYYENHVPKAQREAVERAAQHCNVRLTAMDFAFAQAEHQARIEAAKKACAERRKRREAKLNPMPV